MTTSYVTINGQILYETTNGVRTEYIHDALGSVIGTTDAKRNVQNTYRWAGYGTQIASTGTAPDPKFLWNGTNGYRATGRQYASHYVRRRHYGDAAATWSAADLLWELFGPYAYAKGAPTIITDPTGHAPGLARIPVCISQPPGCGKGFHVGWRFLVVPWSPGYNGYLIQEMHWIDSVWCCTSNFIYPPPDCGCSYVRTPYGNAQNYFEAWLVVLGSVLVPSTDNCASLADISDWHFPPAPCYQHDIWSNSFPSCSLGYEGRAATLKFTTEMPIWYASCIYNCAPPAPSSCVYPFVGFGAAPGYLEYNFACCREGECTVHCHGTEKCNSGVLWYSPR